MPIKYILLLFVFSSLIIGSCKKGDTTPPTTVETEKQIAFVTDPVFSSSVNVSLTSTVSFKVVITSTMPSSGISIDITTKDASTNALLEPAKNYKSTTVSNNVSIGTLQPGATYNVTISVASQKNASNKETKTFSVKLK